MRAIWLLVIAKLLCSIQFISCSKSVWTDKCTEGQCHQLQSQCTRYLLYDVNRGEGFNLKRDIYVRVAPIVVKLNLLDRTCKWVLVLHPWGGMPHWRKHGMYHWSTFFDFKTIAAYVPSMELEDFLDVFEDLQESKSFTSSFYQLQHFPLNSQISDDWRNNVVEVPCESPERFRYKESTSAYEVVSFSQSWTFSRASCVAIKGDSNDVAAFLLNKNSTFTFLDRAEVILWDRYGDHTWWEARKSLKFSQHLLSIASSWIQKSVSKELNSTELVHKNYLAIHVRRRDFVANRKDAVSLVDLACCVASALRKLPEILDIFIASDGSKEELELLRNLISTNDRTASSKELRFHSFPCNDLAEGECAIIDQIICSRAKQFIGTKDSTFTLRIFEEREMMNIEPDYNYHVFCSACTDSSLQDFQCQKATRWTIQ